MRAARALAAQRPVFAAALALAALVLASLFTGVWDLTPSRLAADGEARALLWTSRLPRTLAALLAGASLAVAGLVMQTIARNRFVEPMTAGAGQGAAIGVLIAIVLWPDAPLMAKFLAASLTALGCSAVFIAFASRLPPTQPFLVALLGLAYGGVLQSGLTFAAWQADLIQHLEIWIGGDFSGVLAGRYELLWVAGAVAALAWWTADRLTLMSLGEEASVGLGLDYAAMMRLGLVIVSVIAALTVTTVGLIPFVGLVAPNLVTRAMGDHLRRAVPWTAFAGAALTLGCDVIARLLRYPFEVPVGAVLGVVGAATFLWILIGRRNG